MGKHRISNLTQKLRAAAAILMVSSLGLFYPGTVSNLHAQSPIKAKSSSPGGGPKEGIKVHGRWTIEVRNPDGKLVERREFKNRLLSAGALTLGGLLQRRSKAGEWRIMLSRDQPDPPCVDGPNSVSPCIIYEPSSQDSGATAPYAFRSLTISSDPNDESITVLTGTATAQRNGSINQVLTGLASCPVDSQGVCSGQTFFTGVEIAPINVVAGQIIQVTVVISFS